MSKVFKLAGLVLVFLSLAQVVRAQVHNFVSLSTPNLDAFPVVSTYLEVQDGAGNFVSGLTSGDMTVLENDQQLSATDLSELQPGVQFVVAINPGVAFAPRDSQGKSRYDDIVAALADWAIENEGSHQDQLSFLMDGALEVNHLSDPLAWLEALYAAPADHRSAESNLQILSRAISVASTTPTREGMGQAVLFITPVPDQAQINSLKDLGDLARENKVKLFVWMVASESFFTTQGAVALQEMSLSTGGQFFAYSGTESFPDIETYLKPLRRVYALTYSSKIASEGEHSLAVEINTPAFQANSTPLTFELNVLPPNPILVSPPSNIYRSIITEARTNSLVGHTPEVQTVEILIEFPDGHQRSLARTTLYVNGQISDENTAPPFEVFTWNLNDIAQSGKYEIQVEAVDELGLSSISLPNSVEITVQQPPQGIAAEISRQGSVVSAAVVLLSGSVLIFVLLMIMRRRHDPNDTGKWKKRKQKRFREPVTRPSTTTLAAINKAKRGSLSGWAKQLPNRLPWNASGLRSRISEPIAYLERVYDPNSLEALTPTQPIPITNRVITLGTDPTIATLVLEESSIAGQHARMRSDRQGNFYVLDHGTVAGTWINFSQTNGKEIRIQHGDIIHLGRVGFRFLINNPPNNYEPVIVFEKNPQNGNRHHM